MKQPTCANCNKLLSRGSKLGYCIACTNVRNGKTRRKAPPTCLDCGKPVSRRDVIRCRACCTKQFRINPPNPSGTQKGEKHPSWRGGVTYSGRGYRLIKAHGHPAVNARGYVFEHRLVMEQVLGRYLTADEVVHHKDGDKLNNLPENLELLSQAEHMRLHAPHLQQEQLRDSETGRFLKSAN